MADPISLAVIGGVVGGSLGITAPVAATATAAAVAGTGFSLLGAGIGAAAGAGLGFSAKKFLSSGKDSASKTLQTQTTPQVADDSAAKKKRRIGRNALIFTDQEDILGETPSISRNELIAF